ncbi:Poly [ADP-ribose] polymerase 12 [Folsomia candida]|uniref:Poly [ADP-ribose] polymerase 12 n=2 Tax=Folsomia candida TaxID=158441 RepID=A0A226CYN5_FOLCA|nr:Poly [ADP-ribose] polymerase 12 [Folsomia candida]
MSDKAASSDPTSVIVKDTEIYKYICPSLLPSCPTSSICPYKFHEVTPYKWEVIDTTTPLSQDDGKLLEKQYSNPDLNVGSLSKFSLDFTTMTITSSEDDSFPLGTKIMRKSTPTRNICPDEVNASGWTWYWQRDDIAVNWSEMEVKGGGNETCPFQYLEQNYQNCKSNGNPDDDFERKFTIFGAKRQEYRVSLDFNKMELSMAGDPEKYQVKRRPDTFNRFNWVTFGDLDPDGNFRFPITARELESYFISGAKNFSINKFSVNLDTREFIDARKMPAKMVRIRREAFKSGQLLELENSYPSTWYAMPKSRIFVTFNVPKFTQEFDMVEKKVYPLEIMSLRRIQNPASYKSYLRIKERMEWEASCVEGVTLEEKWLFHGTKDVNIKLICETNFDPTLSGSANGATHGRGTYFTNVVATARGYSNLTSSRVFLCRVLVGRKILGERGKFPPFALCGPVTMVDNLDNPTVFVNPRIHSFLPEYIVEFPPGR